MTRCMLVLLALFGAAVPAAAQTKPARRPNVILIMTDDQGYGDLGFHGNPKIRTPNLDRFARSGVRLRNFHVAPVCSPTRASLLTGRYNYRTGVVDTFIGRSMMHPDERTLAELLTTAGYRTGIFGKWHLGDCYPLRAIDQGFQEALVLRGGGISQPSDPPGGSSYFDPILQHNDKQVQKKGYCSDVFTDAAMDFIRRHRAGPFFCYLAFNCPHGPLQVPEKYRRPYAEMDLSPGQFPKIGFPQPAKINLDETARIYGMVTNIDDNLGRLFALLDELKLTEDTIVIFLTDNGPQQPRYNGGLRGRKGSVFEGGTRVAFFVRWPAGLPGNRDIHRVAAHIDVTPTLLEACGVRAPADVAFDGMSLLKLWKGGKDDLPERTIYFQWHRGEVPQLHRACAARSQKYRLVQPDGVAENAKIRDPRWLLFDIEADPYEMTDLAGKHPEIVARMKKGYEAWFRDVTARRRYLPPRIILGSPRADRVVLTRQDWRGPRAGWGPKSLGHWEVNVERHGSYDIVVTLPPDCKTGTIQFRLGKAEAAAKVERGRAEVTLRDVRLTEGPGQLEAWVREGDATRGVRYVEVRRR